MHCTFRTKHALLECGNEVGSEREREGDGDRVVYIIAHVGCLRYCTRGLFTLLHTWVVYIDAHVGCLLFNEDDENIFSKWLILPYALEI